MPNLTTAGTCLPSEFCEVPILVCVPKSTAAAGNWTQDLPLLGLMLYQLSYRDSRIQCPWCPHVLLVSHGLSLIHQVATPSDTQHAIFALYLLLIFTSGVPRSDMRPKLYTYSQEIWLISIVNVYCCCDLDRGPIDLVHECWVVVFGRIYTRDKNDTLFHVVSNLKKF